MVYSDIYQFIAAKGKTVGVPPSPFGPFGKFSTKTGPDPLPLTKMGRTGGLGNGGGKMLTPFQQGRGTTPLNGA